MLLRTKSKGKEKKPKISLRSSLMIIVLNLVCACVQHKKWPHWTSAVSHGDLCKRFEAITRDYPRASIRAICLILSLAYTLCTSVSAVTLHVLQISAVTVALYPTPAESIHSRIETIRKSPSYYRTKFSQLLSALLTRAFSQPLDKACSMAHLACSGRWLLTFTHRR